MTSGAYSTQLVLIDFGDARLAFDSYVHTLVGSAEFAAPELVRGLPIGFKTDIWYSFRCFQFFLHGTCITFCIFRNVGVIVYVIVSGSSPFATSLPVEDAETRANIIQNNFAFSPPLFESVSEFAIEFIRNILVLDMR